MDDAERDVTVLDRRQKGGVTTQAQPGPHPSSKPRCPEIVQNTSRLLDANSNDKHVASARIYFADGNGTPTVMVDRSRDEAPSRAAALHGSNGILYLYPTCTRLHAWPSVAQVVYRQSSPVSGFNQASLCRTPLRPYPARLRLSLQGEASRAETW